MIEVADIEDPDAAKTLGADGVGHSLSAAVQTPTRLLYRKEQQILVNGGIALTAGAHERCAESRVSRIGNVPDLEAVESALEHQVPLEREVAVQEREITQVLGVPEVLRPRAVTNQLQIASCFTRIGVSGAETDSRVIVGDCDAIALRSRGRRDKRSGKYEQMPEVQNGPSSARRADARSRCHLRSLLDGVSCF